MYKITSKEVSAGYTITQPGLYCLTEDVSWSPTDPVARAVSIECDNVTLDMGGYTIRQANTVEPVVDNSDKRVSKCNVVSGNVGIWALGRKGVTVKNGTVLDVQGVGICLKNCRYVDLFDLTVRGCGGKGIVDTSFLYRNGGLFVMGTKSDDEDSIIWSSDIRMVNCVCADNKSDLDYVVTLGSLVQNCDNVEVINCVFNRTANTSPQPSGVQFNVVGIDFVMCHNVLVKDCEAHDNFSGGEPCGFFAWGENYKFINCRANRNYTINGHRACGFNISTTAHLELVECEANSNYNLNPQSPADAMKDFSACGFRIGRAINRAVIQDCRATGNHGIGANGPVAGFMLNSTKNIVMKNCVAIANRSASGNKGGKAYAAGFLASTVQPANSGDGFWGGEENTFIDCVADGNTVNRIPMHRHPPFPHIDKGEPIVGDPLTGAGFLMDNQNKPKIINCTVINNQGKGIWLIGSKNALIQGNTVSGNTALGIHDENPAGTSLIAGNTLSMNGKGTADAIQAAKEIQIDNCIY
jgi:parallel beta-helix repeat protein